MSAGMIGALAGLALAVLDNLFLRALSRRVDLPETRRVLKITGLSQFVLMPAVGYLVAPFFAGE